MPGPGVASFSLQPGSEEARALHRTCKKENKKKKIFFFVCYVFNSKLKTYALSKFQAPALTPAQSKRTCGNQKAAGWGAASSRPF